MDKKDDMYIFLKKTVRKLKKKENFVELIKGSRLTEYGNQLDCFQCTINQRWYCELICGEFEAHIGGTTFKDVFATVPKGVATYILEIHDYGGELYSGENRATKKVLETTYLCFTTYKAAKKVLRDLVSIYNANGV